MKRLLAYVLTALFLISLLPVSVFAVEEAAIWDGTVATAFAGGSGSQADPYQIADGGQLAYLAQQVNGGTTYEGQYFVLTADIRLNDTSDLENWATSTPANSWTPIGDCSSWPWITFAGSLNGGGHTVSGIYCNAAVEYAGLFSAIDHDGTTIQNLTIADSYFFSPGYVGALAGEIYYCQVRNVTVSNCEIVTSGYNAGGLAGGIYDSTIQNVTVTGGTVSGRGYLAGICGSADNCTLTGCHVAVAIEGVYYDLAGICGYASASRIIGCTSISQIYAACEEEGTCVYEIGGIAGYVDCDSQVVNCLNAGDISVQGDICKQIGGVAGYSEGTVRDCCNTGSVSVAGTGETYEIGGILGCLSEGTVENAYNSGILTVSGGTLESIGGAVGSQYDGTTLQNTYYPDSCVAGGNALGTALTGEAITQESSFPGFDFGWRWEMTSLGPVIATHTVVNGICTHCGQSCNHSYLSGICTDCGESCPHTTMDGGICTACGYRCPHSYEGGVCTVCGMVCDHIYQNGVCTACNMTCDHQWDSTLSMCASCNTLCTHETVENDTCTLCQAVLSGNVWDGSIGSGFDGGTGTKEDPYRIATGAQLAWLGQYIAMYEDGPAFADQYVVLTADINLRNLPFDPIGYSSSEGYNNWFTGWFDGQGHIISGLNINNPDSDTVGLFSSVAKRSEGEAGVVNLHVIGSVTDDGRYVGGIVGRTEQATVSGCTFRGQVTGGYQYTGGILGQGEQGQLLNCKNYASVTGSQWTGGICGGTEYNAPKLDGCINYGAVRGQQYVAGITARHNKMTEYDDEGNDIGSLNPIVNCGNYGTITAMGTEDGYSSCGVYGIAYGFSGEVNNCYNVGDLVAMAEDFTMLGITDSALDCGNSFYACNIGHGYTDAELTAEEMKAQAFVSTLNTAATANGWTQWKRGSAYPVFVTETVEVPTPAITGTALVLDNILRLKVYVQPAGEEYTLRVTAGSAVQELTEYVSDGEQLTFEARLPAHLLHETVTLELLIGDTVVDSKTWTYRDYSQVLQQEHGENEKMMDLVATLNDYGAYTKYFADPVGTAPNAAEVEKVTAAALETYKPQIEKAQAPELKATASLYLDDACDLRLKFNAAAWGENTLYINDEKAEVTQAGEQVMHVISDLTPQQWDDVFRIRVVNGAGETVYQFNYCVLSYASSQLSRTQEMQTGLHGLLKAMYLYSQAANAYVE